MRRDSAGLFLVLVVYFVAGCAQNPPRPASTSISPGSPLAKVHTGMSFEQVVTILGPPSGQESHMTAHAFNPFAVGNQGQITYFYYAKLGRVVFAGPNFSGGGTEVIAVEEDSSESGRPRE